MRRAVYCVKSGQDVAQLVDVLVDRRIIGAGRLLMIRRRGGNRLTPKTTGVVTGVGKGSPDADCADTVQLVSVIETFRLQRLRLYRPIAVTVGLDAVDNIVDAGGLHSGGLKVFSCECGRGHVMRAASASFNRHIMEQRGRAHDFHIRALGFSDARPHLRHSQHMVKVVGRVAGSVELTDFGFA